MSKFCVRNGEKFLFIGDSITDCGRRAAERPYGNGYASLFIELQRWMFPEARIEYVNEGISGNTIVDLKNRWSDDVLRHRPNWVSVKIGINDCNRFLNNVPGAQELGPKDFRKNYDLILASTREKTKARLVLIEPFFISTDRTGLGARTQMLKLLPDYITVVREMAKKHKARLVRTHEMFQAHLKHVAPDFFCPEPVHPFRSGHLFIALELMKTLTD